MANKQPVAANGRVLPEREIVAAELSELLGNDYGPRDPLVEFVMALLFKHYAQDVRFGISLGRKDAVKMLEASAADPRVKAFGLPITELVKVIKALEERQSG